MRASANYEVTHRTSRAQGARKARGSWLGRRLPAPWRIVAALLAATYASACGPAQVTNIDPPRLDPDLVQRGGFLFLDPRVSGDGRRACVTCHNAGATSRSAYLAGEQVEPGTQGARLAPLLRGLYQTGPYLWDGSLTSVGAVLDRMLAVEMRGGQLGDADRRALEAYLLSIPAFDNARTELDGTPTEPATKLTKDGFAVFQKLDCGSCHPAPTYTAGRINRRIGTGGRFNVPSLRGLAKEGPYGHDGRFATLEEAVLAILAYREVELPYRERLALLEYLKLL